MTKEDCLRVASFFKMAASAKDKYEGKVMTESDKAEYESAIATYFRCMTEENPDLPLQMEKLMEHLSKNEMA